MKCIRCYASEQRNSKAGTIQSKTHEVLELPMAARRAKKTGKRHRPSKTTRTTIRNLQHPTIVAISRILYRPTTLVYLRGLLAKGHAIQFIEETPPVVRQDLGVLDPLLRPVLVPPRHVVLGGLEVSELVSDTLADKHGPVMLLDDGFLVLFRYQNHCVSSSTR